jgi:hypothetical protein|tara:strand:- start:242 stop:433 length:192 start_codon:yes stop_codon:yes gene_type:complete
MIRVEGEVNLRRDSHSRAIINVSDEDYREAKHRRSKMQQIDNLTDEVKELKDLVMTLITKLDK